MEGYLNTSIREIIDRYSKVESILNDYGIGCGPCSAGSCLLKDIVEIHRLPADEEREMTSRIAKVIFPGKEIEIPEIRREPRAASGEIKYSPPLKKLVDEHALIKRWVALIPAVIENLDVDSEDGSQMILGGVDFIRSYADKYHHAKEEDILFQYFDENLDILGVMHEDHEKARGYVKNMQEALDRRDRKKVADHLRAYGELLAEHIKKEDEILYPWMDRNLSLTRVGQLFSKFYEADAQLGYTPEKYQAFISNLEKKFKPKEA